MDYQVGADEGMAMGAWEMPEEFQMLRETARRFMKEWVLPEEEKLEHDAYTFPEDILNRLQTEARSLGLWCVQTPAAHGGAGRAAAGGAVAARRAPRRARGARAAAQVRPGRQARQVRRARAAAAAA